MPLRRQRLVVVQRGAIELFERLRARFAEDPATAVIWDRRSGRERRTGADVPVERRRARRRYPNDNTRLLASRGFFIVHPPQHGT